tara:strand:- start:52 stop:192 length:141 start_codon:yes stop_codon:yes gene_type:complete
MICSSLFTTSTALGGVPPGAAFGSPSSSSNARYPSRTLSIAASISG